MTFTAIKVGPMGHHDEQYGTRFWGNVEESDMAVSFNLMQPVDILPGMKLDFEERTIKETGPNSKKPGTEYLFLKKVKVAGAKPLPTTPQTNQSQPTGTQSGEVLSKLDAIAGDVKLVLSFLRQMQKGDSINPEQLDTVIEDIGDEPINLDDIPF